MKTLTFFISVFFVVVSLELAAQNRGNDVSIYFQGNYKVVESNTAGILFSTVSAQEAIQWAVDYLEEKGGEVHLQSGVYSIESGISLLSNITLRGEGPSTLLKFGNKSETVITIQDAEQVTVKNLTLVSTGKGNTIGITMSNAVGCIVKNLKFTGFTGYGCKISGNSFFCRITDSDFKNNDTAILLDEVSESDQAPNDVLGCSIREGNNGIVCKNSSGSRFADNSITGTKINAMYVLSDNVHITGSFITDIGGPAVVLDGNKMNFKGNTLMYTDNVGLYLKNSAHSTVFGNTFSDNGAVAIVIETSSGTTISGNKIHSARTGISESGDCSENIFLGNTISNYVKIGIQANGLNSMNKNNLMTQ